MSLRAALAEDLAAFSAVGERRLFRRGSFSSFSQRWAGLANLSSRVSFSWRASTKRVALKSSLSPRTPASGRAVYSLQRAHFKVLLPDWDESSFRFWTHFSKHFSQKLCRHVNIRGVSTEANGAFNFFRNNRIKQISVRRSHGDHYSFPLTLKETLQRK